MFNLLTGNSIARSKGIQAKEGSISNKPTELKNSSLSIKNPLEQKPMVATTYSRPQSIVSSPIRSTPIANQLSMQRRPSGDNKPHNIEFVGAPTSSSNDLSSVGLLVSSMTLLK